MSVWPKIISILLVFAAGFLFGYKFAYKPSGNDRIVSVKLVNSSGKNISSLDLTHDHGSIEIRDLLDNTATTVKFYAPRETSYNIFLNFEDGKALESGKRYMESSQTVIETVKETEIMPEFRLFE